MVNQKSEEIEQIQTTLKEKPNEIKTLWEVIRLTHISRKLLIQEKGEIWREHRQNISTFIAYVEILLDCEKGIIKIANLEEKSLASALDGRLKDIDLVIDLINILEDETLGELDPPTRVKCVFSLCMLKEKCVVMQVMQEEFEKAIKEINDFRAD